ncbi:MAG TPA: ABC transporter permease [Gemmatimonadales bacterium]|jgi:peptide/nickel transport system permease protein|nr:ABC transporter permease [Gemmatimonadales bacterium]
MRWLAGRVGQAIVTAALAVVLAFFLMRAAPGDPLSRLGDEHPLTPQQVQVLRARYGLDQPLTAQFRAFVAGALHGDFGTSIQYGRPVTDLVLQRLPASLLLGTTVLLITFVLGSWLGAAQALRAGSATEQTVGALSLAAYATPSFWLGLVLAWLVGIEWRLLPAAGMHDPLLAMDAPWATRALDIARHLILPALTLAAVNIGATMRHERSAMLQALREPFVQSARARGLAERRIRWHHAFRNALFPVVTLFGLWLPLVVAGSVFVEKVFAWPGLGALAADAVSARDYPLLMGVTVLVSLMVVGGALVADAAYALLDPRVRRA